MEKLTLAVIFGGVSSEHEVSCMSVINVLKSIDTEKYEPLLIGITKKGHWVYVDDVSYIENGTWQESDVSAELSPDAEKKCVILTSPDGEVDDVFIDAAWPVLHGKSGEDGTIQGLLELAQIPYVGCGVLASAVSMDKFFTKVIVAEKDIRQADFVGFNEYEFRRDPEEICDRVEAKLSYPVFVKPSNAGSSCGASKARGREELMNSIKEAAKIDSKILVEEFIKGREVECSVLGGGYEKVEVAGPGEILSAEETYTYDAKYFNPQSAEVTDPDIPEEKKEEIRHMARTIFNAVDGYGLSRVDFFLKEDGEVIFNEINTMPGFTAISMYPKLWEHAGMTKQELSEKLISLAFKRR